MRRLLLWRQTRISLIFFCLDLLETVAEISVLLVLLEATGVDGDVIVALLNDLRFCLVSGTKMDVLLGAWEPDEYVEVVEEDRVAGIAG